MLHAAIQSMSDAGHETRHIMCMSGYRRESSVGSYNRSVSNDQKRATGATTNENTQLFPLAASSFPSHRHKSF